MHILQAIDDPRVFGPAFRNRASWEAWFSFLAALFGLPMTAEQQRIYRECTQRADLPTEQANEAWLVCGRRAGKSFTLALIAVFLAAFRDWRPYLGPGERGTITVIAADRSQARTIMRYVKGLLHLVFRRFKELSQSKTAILISHRFSTVRMADRIVVLAEGKVEATGTHKELMSQPGRYSELFELQAAASQTERNLPTIADVDARDFSDLACWLIVQIGPISLNVTTPANYLSQPPAPVSVGELPVGAGSIIPIGPIFVPGSVEYPEATCPFFRCDRGRDGVRERQGIVWARRRGALQRCF